MRSTLRSAMSGGSLAYTILASWVSSSLCIRIFPIRIDRQQSLSPCSMASPVKHPFISVHDYLKHVHSQSIITKYVVFTSLYNTERHDHSLTCIILILWAQIKSYIISLISKQILFGWKFQPNEQKSPTSHGTNDTKLTTSHDADTTISLLIPQPIIYLLWNIKTNYHYHCIQFQNENVCLLDFTKHIQMTQTSRCGDLSGFVGELV